MHLHCFSTSCYRYIGLLIVTFLITLSLPQNPRSNLPTSGSGYGRRALPWAQPSLLLCFANQGSLFMKWIIDVMRIARIPELIPLQPGVIQLGYFVT